MASLRARIGAMHDEVASRFKGMAATNAAGTMPPAAAAITADRGERSRSGAGRVSSFIIGSAIGAALGFFARAHL
jgi:hypothetical protein